MTFLTAVILYCSAGTHRCYVEKRCLGSARYEAMAEGHDCFNPPRDPLPKKFKKVWQR